MTARLLKLARLGAVLLALAALGTALYVATDPVLNLIGTGASKLADGVAGFFRFLAHVVHHYIH